MRYIFTFIFFGSFFLVMFRVFLQIRFIILIIKYRNIFEIFGIDKWLFLIPELISVKNSKKKLIEANKITDRRAMFFLLLLKIYKVYILIYFVLFILCFIIK